MSDRDPRGPAAFEPVKVGSRRRRFDPVMVGLGAIALAVLVAIVKPWGAPQPGVAGVATPSATSAPSEIPARGSLVPPTWADVRPVVVARDAWGIRTIVLGGASTAPAASMTPSPPASADPAWRYSDHWYAAAPGGVEDSTAILEPAGGPIVALGVTFPPTETPLDVRVWLEHAGGELEWIDARPVDSVPAQGAYLYLRRGVAGAAVRSWGPGRYRMDVLVGGGIRRIDIQIQDTPGHVPDPGGWPPDVPQTTGFDPALLADEPAGPFAAQDGALVPLAASAGPDLGELGAWLDVDRATRTTAPRSFVARVFLPRVTQLGVVLPAYSSVRTAEVHRLAPFDDSGEIIRETGIVTLSKVSFAVFAPRSGAVLRPGVYSLSITWDDADGSHSETWHVELRPGPLPDPPVLLTATRAWAHFAGSHGVLLGTTESLDGTSQTASIRLLDMTPQTGSQYPGLSGSDLLGCGDTIIDGRPTLIGIVGPPGQDLTPVIASILYPLADTGRLRILTASGAAHGLVLISPVAATEFEGPAAYGFRAGTGPKAPGYTICIGLATDGG